MRAIFFDLFDTLLDKVSFNFDLALDYLYSECIDSSVHKSQLLHCALEYRSQFMIDRRTTCREASFHHQIEYYKEHLPFRNGANLDDLEWEMFTICRTERLGDGALEILKYYKERGFIVVVISNSIFSSKTLRRYANEFGIGAYIDHIFSSADVGVRKPSKGIFDYVMGQLGIDSLEEIYFVGNSLEKDVLGAKMSGLHPIYYCRDGRPCEGDTIFHLLDLIEYFDSRYIFVNSILPYFSAVDGPGFRTVLFLQGCDVRCDGCQNPSSWDISKGQMMAIEDVSDILKKKATNRKITISGGEPLVQKAALRRLLESLYGYDICLYTSFSEQEVPMDIKDTLTYLKVGRFDINRKNNRSPYLGSDNQRFLRLR